MTEEMKALIYKHVFGNLDLATSNEIIDNYDCINRALLLSGAERDTLRAAYMHGPLYDGDVPSKSGRDSLVSQGMIAKVIVKGEDGYNACTYKGAWVFRCVRAALEVGAIE